jgi:hypothetical protein
MSMPHAPPAGSSLRTITTHSAIHIEFELRCTHIFMSVRAEETIGGGEGYEKYSNDIDM